MKKLLLIFFALTCVRAFVEETDFDLLMGKNTSAYKYIQTKEDFERYNIFKSIYDKNINSKKIDNVIPKVIHFIWLGPKKLSNERKKNIHSFIKRNPNWKFKLWTDYNRDISNNCLEICYVDENKLLLSELHKDTINFIEKEDLLRLEVLFNEGGVYVDTSLFCYKTIDNLSDRYDFFTTLSVPHEPILSSSVSVSNSIIGTVPNHPILKHCITYLEENWKKVSTQFSSNNDESYLYRAAYRAYYALNDAVLNKNNLDDKIDIILPCAYFNDIDKNRALYAKNMRLNTWIKVKSTEKDKLERNIKYIKFKIFKLFAVNGILLFISISLISSYWFFTRSKKSDV